MSFGYFIFFQNVQQSLIHATKANSRLYQKFKSIQSKNRTSGCSPEVSGSLQRRRPLLLASFDAKSPLRRPGPGRTHPHGAGHACCTRLQVGRRHGPHRVAPSTSWYHLLTAATLLFFGTGSVYWTIAAAAAVGYQLVSSLVGSWK